MHVAGRTCAAFVLWCGVAAAASAGAGGTVTVDGVTLEPTVAVAVHTVGGWPAQPLVRVYLLPGEVDLVGLAEAIDVEEALTARAGGDYAYVTFTADGEVLNVGVVLDGSRNFGFPPPEREKIAFGGGTVSGRVFTSGQQELMDSVYAFDLTFAATVVEPPKASAVLGAGGGASGACYLAYLKGVREGDAKLVTAHGSPGDARELAAADELSLEYLLSSLKDLAPQEMAVDGGAEYGAYSILQVHGRDWSGDAVKGAVKMERDGTSWRVVEEKLETSYE